VAGVQESSTMAAELELTGAVVRAARVWESEIGRVYEPQWVAAVLLEY
jgi:hypothetical protein